jgi:cobalt-zinc-cadmium efflux system membrane fusion protein
MKTERETPRETEPRRFLPPALALLLGASVLASFPGCGGGGPGGREEPAETPGEHEGEEHEEGIVELSPEKLSAVEIETAPVERRNLSALLETTGEVGYEEDRIAHVAPRVPGRVQQVPVSLGDEVRRGQILAVLDSVELGQAKAAYLGARTRENLARQNFERERRLYEDRITSEREMLEARAAYEEAVSVRESAQETLRLYGVPAATLEGLRPGDPGASLLPVHAPIAGRIVEKHATLGELATPEDTLFTIGDLGHVWIWIDVYERDLGQVHLGDGVEVAVESFPGRAFSGEVTYLSPEVAAETRTVRARIDVENPERMLRPGMFATVRLVDPHTEDASPSLVVLDHAVVRRGDATFVFVPASGPGGDHAGARFEARPVRLGRYEGGWVEVLSGLEAGEEVVTGGTFFLESELAREELGGGHSH